MSDFAISNLAQPFHHEVTSAAQSPFISKVPAQTTQSFFRLSTYLYLDHVLIATSLANTSDCPKYLISGKVRSFMSAAEIVIVENLGVAVLFSILPLRLPFCRLVGRLVFGANRDVVP